MARSGRVLPLEMPVGAVVCLRLIDHIEYILDREGGCVEGIRIGQAAGTRRLVVVIVARGLGLMLMMLQHIF